VKKGPIYRRLARRDASELYERGWREGWHACLAKVQDEGIDQVLVSERRLDDPTQLLIPIPEVR
jgi:hypothetical protein